jgi:hypothetical protein
MRTLPRLALSFLVLLAVLIPVSFAVVLGEATDLDAFAYAVPIGALAIVVLASIGYRLAAPGRVVRLEDARRMNATHVRRAAAHPSVQLAFSVAGLAIVGGFFLASDAETRAYRDDPTCALILTYEPPDAGACRVRPARIVDTAFASGRGGTHRRLRLAFENGTSRWIELAGSDAPGLWRDARRGVVRDAVAQWYHGRIVAVSTTSGRAPTDAMPSVRLSGLLVMSLVLATSGLASAARILLTGNA